MKLREFVELSPILLPWATVPSLTSRALKLCQPGSSVSAHTTGSLDALKLSLDDSLIALASAFSEEEGERCAEELLVKNRPFTALVCANDRLAIGAIAALQRHGVICPDDVSVTGLHDMPFASRLQPPPTTIRIQHNKAGIEAAEVMVQLLESPLSEKARHIVLPVQTRSFGDVRDWNRT